MKSIPLRYVVSLLLISLVLVISISVWYITYSSSRKDLEDLATAFHSQSLTYVNNLLDDFMGTPQRKNQDNLLEITSGLLDYRDPEKIGNHLFSQFLNLDSVITMEYADEQRNDLGPARGLFGADLSFGISGPQTGYTYRLYEIDKEGNRGRVLWEDDDYDPREKSWYTQAAKMVKSSWTPIYLWPNGDVGLDAVTPIRINNLFVGVLDSAMTLKGIGDFLKQIRITKNTQIYVLERSGLVVASSSIGEPFISLDRNFERLSATASGATDLINVMDFLSLQKINLEDIQEIRQFVLPGDSKRFISVSPYSDEYGLDWLIVLTTPESDIMWNLFVNNRRTQVVILTAIILSLALALLVSLWITTPLSRLSEYAGELSAGNWDQKIDIKRRDEIGSLAEAFRKMSAQLKAKSKSLEQYASSMVSERQKLEAILRSMADPVIVTDNQKKIVLVNQAFVKTFGFSNKEPIGRQLASLNYHLKISLADREKITDMIDVLFGESGSIVDIPSIEAYSKNGQLVVVDGVGSRLKDYRGKLAGIVVVFRDITKKAQLEKLRADFVSLASHQLNTPLTGIKWTIGALLKDKIRFPQKTFKLLNTVFESNEKLILLVNDLLKTSKVETGKIEKTRLEIVPIKTIISSAITDVKDLYKRKKMKIEGLNKISFKPKVNVDKEQIIQLFVNLLQNAATYSDPQKTIHLKMETKNNQVIVSITDLGYGIPKKEQPNIFEKFFRASNISNHIPGTGLGLYFVKNVAENHGGKVWFESEEGKGSTFFVRLPLIKN